MPVTTDLTETDLFTALRAFAQAVLPTGIEVIRAQVNRVPEPKGPDFVIMNSAVRQPAGLPRPSWDQTNPAPTTMQYASPAIVTIQCDVHGPAGADNAWTLAEMWRTMYGCDFYSGWCSTNGKPEIRPLYTPDPKQVPFINGEQQYEDRWCVEAIMEARLTLTVLQDFAAALKVGLIEVDSHYPP